MIKLFTKKRKGFTLIELVVVIAILGILAALAIPRLTGTRTTAANNSNIANIKTLRSSANIAVADHGAPKEDVTWEATGNPGTAPHLWDDYLDTFPTVPTGATQQGAYKVVIKATTGDVEVYQGSTLVTP